MKRRHGGYRRENLLPLTVRIFSFMELPLEIVLLIKKFLNPANPPITFDIKRPIYRNQILRGWAGTQRRRNQDQVCARFWSYQTRGRKHVGVVYGAPEDHLIICKPTEWPNSWP